MATRDSEQARPGQDVGEETRPAGASKSPRADADDDPHRVNVSSDQRADDSSGPKGGGADQDRPRDGT